jgi:hypothetical protein
MTEAQIPVMALLAFLGGCFAGGWIRRSFKISILLLVATIVLDIAGWLVYGFTVNWRPSWGIQNVIFGSLYALPGMVLFAGGPAIGGFGVSILVVRLIFQRGSHSNGDKPT